MPAEFGDNPSLIILRTLVELQDKASRIISFLPDTAPLREIYKNSEILKLSAYIALQNTLLTKDFFNEELPKSFNEHFKKLNDQHQHATRSSTHNSIFVPKVHTETYGKHSIKYQSTKLWSNINKLLCLHAWQPCTIFKILHAR